MTDTEKLNGLIVKRGFKKTWIAAQMGLSLQGLAKKIKNDTQFNAGEIQTLCKLLDISDLQEKERIFFAKGVDD